MKIPTNTSPNSPNNSNKIYFSNGSSNAIATASPRNIKKETQLMRSLVAHVNSVEEAKSLVEKMNLVFSSKGNNAT